MTVASKSERALRSLARLHGIQPTYRDGKGVTCEVPTDTLRVLLTGMHVSCSSDEEVRREIVMARTQSRKMFLDSVYVLWEDQRPGSWWVNLPQEEWMIEKGVLSWAIIDEAGNRQRFDISGGECSVVGKQKVGGKTYLRVSLPYPENCKPGYYQLQVKATGFPKPLESEALLIVAPRHCYFPERPPRAWGLTAQLYGLRSSKNWGIGDFRDLTTLAEWAGPRLGVDTIGLNPLHALAPTIVSPYSPSSRLFHNPVYLDMEAIEECQAEKIQSKIQNPLFQARLKGLRDSEMVDYQAVRALKDTLLEEMYHVFVEEHILPRTERSRGFEQFLHEEGQVLERFAVFQVLQETYKGVAWKQWPAPFQTPDSVEVAEWTNRNRERVRFHQYVQWQCTKQLKTLSDMIGRTGIQLGLYHDLAIGIHPDGADAWMFQDQLAGGVEVGAPPDTFNLSGQTWGLQPPLPHQLRQTGYKFIRDTFRYNMEYGGILRIDHALGLFRLYWVPTGLSGSEGAYVHYRSDELLAILALESVRHQVMVVGEDLGTVTPAIHQRLAQAGLLSYRLLMFEQTGTGRYRRPGQFPAQALLSINTHDLPTLRGYWIGRDIDVKEQVGLYPTGEQAKKDRVARAHARKALLQALKKEGLLPAGITPNAEVLKNLPDELCQAIYMYLARSASWVVATSLEDLLGEVETPNVPGAPDGTYPVWRRKIDRFLEEICHDQKLSEFAAAIRSERELSARQSCH